MHHNDTQFPAGIHTERLVRPAFMVTLYSQHLRESIEAPVAVPNGVYPMDLFNALLRTGVTIHDSRYGWLTSKGRYVHGKDAVNIGIQIHYVDHVTDHLTTDQFLGEWRAPR